jgi:hypothetical protein
MRKPSLSAKLQLALDACRAIGPTATGGICLCWIGEDFKVYRLQQLQASRSCPLQHLVRGEENGDVVSEPLTPEPLLARLEWLNQEIQKLDPVASTTV